MSSRNKDYKDYLKLKTTELKDFLESSLTSRINYISHDNYLFKSTLKENLLLAKPNASDKELWQVLKRTNLDDFLKSEQDLETRISDNDSNLSSGQKQRLALSRALLHNSEIYIL